MSKAPDNPYIFHITAVNNISTICADGCLRSKNQLNDKSIPHVSIAYENIQQRRHSTVVPIGSGGTLHDYVLFYFAPRSPMLMTINNGNVPSCTYRQDDIIHIVSSVKTIVDAQLPYVFYDMHAILSLSTAFNSISDLDKIEWELFFEQPVLDGYCKYWQNKHEPIKYLNRKETRQAEFLIKDKFDIEYIEKIGVINKQKRQEVESLLHKNGVNINVEVVPGWYY